MKKILITVFILFELLGCNTESGDSNRTNNATETSQKTDTVINYEPASQDQAKRLVDSILKAAGAGATVQIETTPSKEPKEKIISSQEIQILKTLNIKRLDSLISSEKSKYTLVHFWATWCAPCKREFPDFIKKANDLKETNIILVSCDYDSDEQKKKVLATYQKLETTIPCYITETKSKSDLLNKAGQLELIGNYDKKSNGGLPYNLLIENNSKKLVIGTGNYIEAISKAK